MRKRENPMLSALVTLRYLLAAAVVLTLLGAVVLGIALSADSLRAYTHRERLAGVAVLGASELAGREVRTPRVARDFDGDRTADDVETEYMRREPLLARITSGMLRVRSGADGSVLAQRATETPICRERWLGDVDGNGTDDLEIEDGLETFVLARAR